MVSRLRPDWRSSSAINMALDCGLASTAYPGCPSSDCPGVSMKIRCADGRELAATLHRHQTAERRGVLLVNAATGVPQTYYRRFAKHFAHSGFDVLTWDPRGIGASRQGSARGDRARMR